MATSKLDVFNLALGACGSSRTIESLTENSTERNACSRFYDQCVDYVLQDAYWGAATKSKVLAVLNQTFPGYAYVYAYPDDCLFMRAITDSAGDRLVQGTYFSCPEDLQLIPTRVPFKIITTTDLQARAIATDLPSAYGIYTARVTVPAVWGPTLTEAIAYRLAYKISPSLQVEASLIGQLHQQYLMEKGKAGEADLNEQRADQEPESPSIGIRG